MRLPKPIYEALPYFLIGVGILFVYLVMTSYEYASTLLIWLLGVLCIVAGAAVLTVRFILRRQLANVPRYADDD